MSVFKAHDPKLGNRLERQVTLGPSGLFRQVRDAPGAADVTETPLPRVTKTPPEVFVTGKKGGRAKKRPA